MEFLFGLLNLQFDRIQRIWQTFLSEAADKWSDIPLLLCCIMRVAQLRRLRLQFQSVLVTLPAFDAEKRSIFRPALILSRNYIDEPPSYDLLASPKQLLQAAGPILHSSTLVHRRIVYKKTAIFWWDRPHRVGWRKHSGMCTAPDVRKLCPPRLKRVCTSWRCHRKLFA